MLPNQSRGFTLVELLIVIGILAVLATTAVVILNPAQLLAQARDSQRFSDLKSIQNALAVYLSQASSPSLGTCPDGGSGEGYFYSSNGTTEVAIASFVNSSADTVISDKRFVDGTGWIPVNFNAIPAGSPFAVLPIDPLNQPASFFGYAYRYACDATAGTFELDAFFESTKYRAYSNNEVDGGDRPFFYEVGTDLEL